MQLGYRVGIVRRLLVFCIVSRAHDLTSRTDSTRTRLWGQNWANVLTHKNVAAASGMDAMHAPAPFAGGSMLCNSRNSGSRASTELRFQVHCHLIRFGGTRSGSGDVPTPSVHTSLACRFRTASSRPRRRRCRCCRAESAAASAEIVRRQHPELLDLVQNGENRSVVWLSSSAPVVCHGTDVSVTPAA